MANEKDLKELSKDEKQNVDGGYVGSDNTRYSVYDDETNKRIPIRVINYGYALETNNFVNNLKNIKINFLSRNRDIVERIAKENSANNLSADDLIRLARERGAK